MYGTSAATVALHGKSDGAEPVERAQQQHPAVGEGVRTGVLVAGAGVEVQEEQVRRERARSAASIGARRSSSATGRTAARILGDGVGVWRHRAAGVPRLQVPSSARKAPAARSQKSSTVAVARRGRRRDRRMPGGREHLAADQRKFAIDHRCTPSIWSPGVARARRAPPGAAAAVISSIISG